LKQVYSYILLAMRGWIT